MISDYSPKEVKLISEFGFNYLCEYVDPMKLYEMCALKAFEENLSGSHVEALRRVITALNNCKPYRLTPEFEKLLEY